MAKQIKKLRVNIISLVSRPANRKTVLYKSDDGNSIRFEFDFKALTKDTKEGIIYGCVYEPDTVDTQGDFADAEVIKEAAHDFMERGSVHMVDLEHDEQTGRGTIVQSFIKNGEDSRFPDVKNGGWCVGIKLGDEAKQHIDEIGGLSLQGVGSYKAVAAKAEAKIRQKGAPAKGASAKGARTTIVNKGARVVARVRMARNAAHARIIHRTAS